MIIKECMPHTILPILYIFPLDIFADILCDTNEGLTNCVELLKINIEVKPIYISFYHTAKLPDFEN